MEKLKTVEKLKSVFRNPRFTLPLKALIFGAALRYYYATGGLLPGAVFLAAAIALYTRHLFNINLYIKSFAALVILALAWPEVLSERFHDISTVIFAGLFYTLIGIKDLLFVERGYWHKVFFASQIYLGTLAYFLADKSESYFAVSFLAVIFFFVLAADLISQGTNLSGRVAYAVSGALSILHFELLWGVGILPIGFINSANASVFVILILVDGATAFHNKQFSGKFIKSRIIMTAIVSAIILLTSRWHL